MIGLPPLYEGEDQFNTTILSLILVYKLIGAFGTVIGVTILIALGVALTNLDIGPVSADVTAATINVYKLLFVSPNIVVLVVKLVLVENKLTRLMDDPLYVLIIYGFLLQ